MKLAPLTELGFAHRFERGSDPQAPTLLLLHGTGGDENDLIPLGQAIAPGAALLSPRGKVLEHGMPRFFRRLAEGVFDQKDLARRTAELSDFVEAASREYGFAQDRLMAVGFSNGANIAASMLFRFPEKLAVAVLFRAMVPFVPEQVPDLHQKPILMLSGLADPIIPASQAEELAGIFRSAGANITFKWLQTGHALTQADLTTASDWIRKLPAHRRQTQ